MQMRAISELFESTCLVVPSAQRADPMGEAILSGNNLRVAPLMPPYGRGGSRKALFPAWILANLPTVMREVRRADAIHAPIPGDIGTLGMLVARLARKPLFVRHCGNWFGPRTKAERFWRWYMEEKARPRDVMLATGHSDTIPSAHNERLKWIFSTSLTEGQLQTLAKERTLRNPKGPRLAFVGRLEHKKGLGDALEAMPLLLKDHPGTQLDVMGAGSAEADFKRHADSLGIAHAVTFHGKVRHAEVMANLGNADVFVFPTAASEGFPKAVLEALACGLPVVTTGVSALPKLVAGCGHVVEPVSAETIARAVADCVASPDRYTELSRRALEAARPFSLENWRDTIGGHLRAAWCANG